MRAPAPQSLSLLVYLVAWTVLAGTDPPRPEDAGLPRSPQELLERTRAAFQSRDWEALEGLMCWDRVIPYTREFSRDGLRHMVTCDSIDLRLDSLGAREPEDWADSDGTVYRHNLPAEGVVEVRCGPGENRWAYGRDDSGYRFTIYVASDTLPDPEDDPVLKGHGLSGEARTALRDYYDGKSNALELVNDAVTSLQAQHPTLQARGVRALLLVLENAAAAETTGQVPWVPTPFINGPTHVNRARELRAGIGSGLRQSLPACAFPLAQYFLEREPVEELRLEGGRILSLVAGPQADSLILELIERPREDRTATKAALSAAGERELRASPWSLRRLALGDSPSVAESARVLNARLGYPPLPDFDPTRAFRSRSMRRLLATLSTLLIDHPPARSRLVRVDLCYASAEGDTSRSHYRGWLERESPDSIAILTPSGRHESWPKYRAEHSDSGELSSVSTAAMAEFDPRDEIAAEAEGDFGGDFLEHADQDVHRLAVAEWLARRNESEPAAEIFVPLVDAYPRPQDLIEHVRWFEGLLVGYRMFVAFAGARDYPKAMALARLIRDRYPDTMFSKYADQFLVELPERMDDFRGFRLPTPDEWIALQGALNRDQQIEYLCRRLRLLNTFQWGQPGGLALVDLQTAEPQGLAADASWGLDRGRTRVINPVVQLTGERDPESFFGDSLNLEISDIPQLAEHLRDDWFILGVEFWRDFRAERHLYRTSQILAFIINEVAEEPVCDADDWPLLSSAEKDDRIRSLAQWAEENRYRSQEERVMRRLDRASRWYDVEPLLPTLYEYDRKDAVPRLLSFFETENTSDYSRSEILRACRRLDGAQAESTAATHLTDADPSIRMESGIIEIEHGDRASGEKAVTGALDQGTYSTLSPSTALEGVNALLALDSEAAGRAADAVLERSYFTSAWDHDQAPILKALMAAERSAPYRWLIDAVQDTTPRGSTYSGKQIRLRRQDWIANLVVGYLAPRDAGLVYDEKDPEDRKAEARARIRLWLEDRLAALPPRTSQTR